MDTTVDPFPRLVTSTRANWRQCAEGEASGRLVRVFRRTFVEATFLSDCDRWTREKRASLVRALAVSAELGTRAVLIGQAAALVHGVETLDRLVDVDVVTPGHHGHAGMELPEICCPGAVRIPARRVVLHRDRVPESVRVRVGGAVAPELPTVAVQCARLCDPMEAVVVVSGALRKLSAFDRFRMSASRKREGWWRGRLLACLAEYPACPGKVRAASIIDAADAGCESVAERVLLWILKSRGVVGVVTQAAYPCGETTYYVDFQIAGTHLVIEFDGKEKYGDSISRVLESLSDRDARQKRLEAAGLIVLRFEYRELEDPDAVVAEVVRHLPRGRRPWPRKRLASARGLWQESAWAGADHVPSGDMN